MRIFCPLLHRTLGDFIEQAVFAATVKEQFDRAELDVYFVDDRPYKKCVLEMLPQIDRIWRGMPIPMDWFDTAFAPPAPIYPPFVEQGVNACDLMLLPGLCKREYLPSFDRLAQFKIPEEWDHPTPKLDSWHAVLHYREPGAPDRPDRVARDVEVGDIAPVIAHVIGLGGRVVRIGPEEMSRLRERPGYADWSRFPFESQAAAVSTARIFIELTPSGPAALCHGFNTPWLRANSVILEGPTHPQDVLLPQHIFDADGVEQPTNSVIARGIFTEAGVREAGLFWRKNSVEEVVSGIDRVLSSDRASWVPPLAARPNKFTVPPPIIRKHSVMRLGQSAEPKTLAA